MKLNPLKIRILKQCGTITNAAKMADMGRGEMTLIANRRLKPSATAEKKLIALLGIESYARLIGKPRFTVDTESGEQIAV